jgi:Family of unknown function (DUF6174)
MTHRRGWWLLAAWLMAASLATGCGGPSVTPSPPATPVPTVDPRRAEIDQAEAAWEAHQPDSYAYTASLTRGGSDAVTAYRVTGMDGRVELQAVTDQAAADAEAMTIEGLFEAVRSRLDADGSLEFSVDPLYGYLSKAAYTAPTREASWTRSIEDFTTAATRASAARARDALAQAQERWNALATPAWEYTWTRFAATDPAGGAPAWRVRHEEDATTISAAGGATDATPPDAVTIGGTVSTLAAVLAAGGWVDVAADSATGLDMLVAVDPSPSVTGDAYWIRIDTTDLSAQQASKSLAAARDRWSASGPRRYSYTWRFEGPGRDWTYRVSVNGAKVTIKAGEGTPTVQDSFAPPGIADSLDLVERVLAGGGMVTAAYDKRLGYPTRIVLPSATGTTPEGTITITGFRTR